MTPISIAYFVLGLVTLFWPLATLFFKRRVLDAQWLMVAALAMVGISIIIYSTFFNSFLKGEYILVLLYMFLSLIAVPMTQVAVTSLTRPQGVSRMARLLAIPSFAVIVAMFLSIFIGTPEMYRLWIERGADGQAGVFYAGSWRYNLVVAIHYYLYWIVLMAELVYMIVYVANSIRRFGQILNEYYTAEQHNKDNIRGIYITVGVNCLCIFINYLFFPFNSPRPVVLTSAICLVQAVDIFMIGWYLNRINFGAESLREKFKNNHYGRGNLVQLGRQIGRYVEEEQGFLNPDLSVFQLSEQFKVTQDDIVDAIHRTQGTSFGNYIDNLRVERATTMILAQQDFDLEDPEQMARLAHSCGYLTTEALQQAFASTLQMSIKEWVKGQ